MISNVLRGNKIELRALEPEDLEILYAWENDADIWKVSERNIPVSKYLLKQYLENAHQDIYEAKQLRLIIQSTENSKALGAIDLFDFDPYHRRAGLGILIAEGKNRRKGYATESLELMKSYCSSILNLHSLYCSISRDNKASLELFTNAGFEITGTRVEWIFNGREFIDDYFLQLVFSE